MKTASLLALSLLLAMPISHAKVSAEQAARLGHDLTPMGAERAGNADGSIPEWKGGLARQAVDAGKGYRDPFAADRPLFTIDANNYRQYQARLTPGQIETFKRYKNYTMKVFPTRRSAAYPAGVYAALKKNALRAELIGTDSLRGAVTGPAFPIPRNGAEAIWNHKTKYIAPGLEGYYNAAVVTRGGDFVITRVKRYAKLKYNRIGIEPADLDDNIFLYYLTYVLSPPRLAGNIVLVHQTIDQLKEPNMAWSYSPGQRRVRRAPELGYDNPTLATDSLGTHDQVDIFNGALDRYDWKLLGKREIYIPYNSYRLEARGLKPEDVIRPGHINQDLARYELHRVWVVDATVRQGMRHLYKRRTFYLDEDSWYIAYVDCYDQHDELWRIQEGHLMTAYDLPAVVAAIELGYDFTNGRYVVAGLDNLEKPTDYRWTADDGFFTPAAMRRGGLR
ncbi:MAG TPA: DUF1329 domain-containing protein [Solimonas sp.]|nr:DUF1329 domain-containing protein [Solimonas sp.]